MPTTNCKFSKPVTSLAVEKQPCIKGAAHTTSKHFPRPTDPQRKCQNMSSVIRNPICQCVVQPPILSDTPNVPASTADYSLRQVSSGVRHSHISLRSGNKVQPTKQNKKRRRLGLVRLASRAVSPAPPQLPWSYGRRRHMNPHRHCPTTTRPCYASSLTATMLLLSHMQPASAQPSSPGRAPALPPLPLSTCG